MSVPADGCDIPLTTTSVLEGLRAVVVDVDVPSAQTIGVVLGSASTAALIIGGKPALTRGYELGGGRVERWASAAVEKGRVRVVARIGSNGEGSRVRLNFYAEDGAPLATRAPKPGEAATLVASRAGEDHVPRRSARPTPSARSSLRPGSPRAMRVRPSICWKKGHAPRRRHP